MDFSHYSVMAEECIRGLAIRADGVYLDGTAGGGGHSGLILERLSDKGRLVAVDRDKEAVAALEEKFRGRKNVTVVNDRFGRLSEILDGLGIEKIDGLLLDLGVSSHQLDMRERGFSYRQDAEVDMRMDQSKGLSAGDVVNTYDKESLARIFYEYGEERFSRRIAEAIVSQREKGEIRGTVELADIIKNAMPAAARREKGHPAKRCFQALRIEVNDELGELSAGLENGWNRLGAGGRMVVLTFHSLEDRKVKQFFRDKTRGCVCPPEFPVCVCGRLPQGRFTEFGSGAVTASAGEMESNLRSHSAKLRVIEKM